MLMNAPKEIDCAQVVRKLKDQINKRFDAWIMLQDSEDEEKD